MDRLDWVVLAGFLMAVGGLGCAVWLRSLQRQLDNVMMVVDSALMLMENILKTMKGGADDDDEEESAVHELPEEDSGLPSDM